MKQKRIKELLFVIAVCLWASGCSGGGESGKAGSSVEPHASKSTSSGIWQTGTDEDAEPDYEAMDPLRPTDGYISEYTTYEYSDDSDSNYTKTQYIVNDGEETISMVEIHSSWIEGNVEILRTEEQKGTSISNISEYRFIRDEGGRVLKREGLYNGELFLTTDYEYHADGTLARTTERNELSGETVMEEYEAGVRTDKRTVDDKGQVIDWIEYTIDGEGRVQEECHYTGDRFSMRVVWHYFDNDRNGGRKQKTEYNSDGVKTRIIGYDSHGMQDFVWSGSNTEYVLTEYEGDSRISWRQVSEDYYVSSDHRYVYSDGGRLLRSLEYTTDGRARICIVYYYDELGRRIKEETYKDSTTFNLEETWEPQDLISAWYEDATVVW